MTWLELADFVYHRMNEEQKTDDVTICVTSRDEMFGVALEITGEDSDILSPNTFYLETVE